MRDVVRRLVEMGPLPSSDEAETEHLRLYEELLREVATQRVSDEEARALCTLFGADDCYGLAWTMMHLIEAAPGWPLHDCLETPDNEWIERLRQRIERKRTT